MAATDRGPDNALIDEHLQRVAHLLLPMVARYESGKLSATPEGKTLLAAPAELRASLAVAALAGPGSGRTAAHVVEVPRSEQWPAELVRALVRRKIAWDPESAALALRLVAATDFDDERIQLVLKAADHIVDVRPGHAAVMDGLDRLNERVLATSTERYRVPEMRARVIASISRHSPPDLVDLSAIAETDTWGPAALAILQAAAMDGIDVRSLLGCLTVASSATAPTARWRAPADPAIASTGTREVVENLVNLLVDLDLDDQRVFVAAGNDSVARAAIWALGQGDVAPTHIALLQSVASRCSRTNGKPYVTEALCGKAVGAAITVLDQLRQGEGSHAPAADRALTEFWSDVDRGDVLKRIGRALGRSDDEIAARVVEAKRSKNVAKSARINPQPADRSKSLTEVIDEDLTVRLRRQGFDERNRRTFRRHHLARARSLGKPGTARERPRGSRGAVPPRRTPTRPRSPQRTGTPDDDPPASGSTLSAADDEPMTRTRFEALGRHPRLRWPALSCWPGGVGGASGTISPRALGTGRFAARP